MLKCYACRDNSSINPCVMFQRGSKNRVNSFIQSMQLALLTESAYKNSTSEFMLELVGL